MFTKTSIICGQGNHRGDHAWRDLENKGGRLPGFCPPANGDATFGWYPHQIRVSGYICPNKDGMRGEGATHAWAEAYLPGYAWE